MALTSSASSVPPCFKGFAFAFPVTRDHPLSALHERLCAVRVQAIREFLAVMNEHEAANTGYFERLQHERESTTPEPAPAG